MNTGDSPPQAGVSPHLSHEMEKLVYNNPTKTVLAAKDNDIKIWFVAQLMMKTPETHFAVIESVVDDYFRKHWNV